MRIKKILCLILFTIVMVLILPTKTTDSNVKSGNTYGNIANFGLVAQNGDYYYYSNVNDNWKLYRVKSDDSGNVKISDDKAQYINVVDSKIYYSNSSDNWKIYSMNTDGTGRVKLNDDISLFINVVDDYIYYVNASDGWKITRMNKDGTGKKVISENKASCLAVTDGWAYYLSWKTYGRIYRVRLDGTDEQRIAVDRARQFVVNGNKIYYINEGAQGTIWTISVNDFGPIESTRRNLIDGSFDHAATSLNIRNDILYYTDRKTGHLYYFDLNKTPYENKLLSNKPSYLLNVVDNWIFSFETFEEHKDYIYYDGLARVTYDGKKYQDGTVIRNEQIASDVEKTIASLPLKSQLKLTDKPKVEAARASYDKLTAEQKKLVLNYNVLVDLEKRLVELEPKEILSNTYRIDKNNNIISKIQPETKVETFLKNVYIESGGSGVIDVYDASGNNVTANKSLNIGTGFKVTLTVNGKVEDEKTVLIYGDLSGDGRINSTDMLLTELHILRKRELTGVNRLAAKLANRDNGKDIISSTDMLIMELHILNKKAIVQ